MAVGYEAIYKRMCNSTSQENSGQEKWVEKKPLSKVLNPQLLSWSCLLAKSTNLCLYHIFIQLSLEK